MWERDEMKKLISGSTGGLRISLEEEPADVMLC